MDLRKKEFERMFVGVLALVVSAVFLWMIAGYLVLLFLAAVFTLLLQPVHDVLTARFGGRQRLAAVVTVCVVVLTMLIPAAFFLLVVVEEAGKAARLVTPFVKAQIDIIHEYGAHGLSDRMPEWVPFQTEIILYAETATSQLGDLAKQVTPVVAKTLRASSGSVGKVLVVSLDFVFFVYALLFFLLTAHGYGADAVSLLPLSATHRAHLVERVQSTIRATVKGSFLIALVQGTLTGLGLWATNIPLPLFWGALTAVLSIIPLVGPPLVWIPATIWLLAINSVGAAAALFIWGALIVSSSDNLLRPVLVGADAQMSNMMILLSTLGGVTLFGPVGIIIGPLIAALFSAVWFIFREVFDELLDHGPEGSLEGALKASQYQSLNGGGDEDALGV